MPTVEDYDSDPAEMELDVAASAPAAAAAPSAAAKGKGPALPADFAGDSAIPKALRVAADGSFAKPLNDEYTK